MKSTLIAMCAAAALLSGCNAADTASSNLSAAADNFEIPRRIVFFDTWTNTNLMVIEGLCALGNNDKEGEISVTCEVGPGQFKKHFLGLSNNVTYFVEQMDPAVISKYHYRVIFRPETLIPELEVQ